MMNYTVDANPAVKNTITITRYQLWKNYIAGWSDMVVDGSDDMADEFQMKHLKEVIQVLCGKNTDNLEYRLRKLFRDGYTCFLMGDAMKHIDTGFDNVFAEIVVIVGEQKIVIDNTDINY